MYYFAYGSNMNLEHMRRICGWHFHVVGNGELHGYELGVDKRGYANIRPSSDEKVWGVLYECDQQCIDSLDKFEGYPEIFDRKEVEVKQDDRVFKAWVYIEPNQQLGGTDVRVEYFRRVIAAAEENRLPQGWIEKLKKITEGK